MIGDVLAEGTGRFGIGDLLELEQVVVERRDGFEGAEADVEIAVEALWRGGRGGHQRSARRGCRRRCECAWQRSATDGCGAALEHVASAERMIVVVLSRHCALPHVGTCAKPSRCEMRNAQIACAVGR